jgi:large subunit ribosomal protein L4
MEPKTSVFVSLLKTMNAETKKVMVVVSQKEEGIKLSVRNLKKVELVSTANLNAYNVLHNDKVLFSEEAITQLSTIYL